MTHISDTQKKSNAYYLPSPTRKVGVGSILLTVGSIIAVVGALSLFNGNAVSSLLHLNIIPLPYPYVMLSAGGAAALMGMGLLISQCVQSIQKYCLLKKASSIHWVAGGNLGSQDLTAIDALIARGDNVNTCDANGHTPLQKAIRRNNIPLVNRLLSEKTIDVNKTLHENQNSALHLAVRYFEGTQGLEVVKKLLEKGAKLDAVDVEHFQPIHWAMQQQKREFLNYFLTIQNPLPQDLPFLAITTFEDGPTLIEIIDQLHEKGLPFNLVDKKKRSLLHWALFNNKPLLAHHLLTTYIEDMRSLSNTMDNTNNSPLHYAVSTIQDIEQACALIPLLVAAGAAINSGSPTTPFYTALKSRIQHKQQQQACIRISKALVGQGADHIQTPEQSFDGHQCVPQSCYDLGKEENWEDYCNWLISLV